MTCFLSSAGTHQQGTAAGGRGASSGSIRCQRCREVCKGEVVRVQDTHFHVKCFTCTGKAGVQGIVGKHERGCTVLSWGMGGCCVKVPQGWGGSGLSCPVFLFWGENKMNGSLLTSFCSSFTCSLFLSLILSPSPSISLFLYSSMLVTHTHTQTHTLVNVQKHTHTLEHTIMVPLHTHTHANKQTHSLSPYTSTHLKTHWLREPTEYCASVGGIVEDQRSCAGGL